MRYFLIVSIVFLLSGCAQAEDPSPPALETAVSISASDPVVAANLQAVALQAGDLPAKYQLTLANVTPEASDLPEGAEQNLDGFLLRQFEFLGNMTVVSTLVAYKDETAAGKAFDLFKEGVETYSDELKVAGLTDEYFGRQASFNIGKLTQSNGSLVFRQGKFIASFLFVNQSGSLDHELIQKIIHLVSERLRKIPE